MQQRISILLVVVIFGFGLVLSAFKPDYQGGFRPQPPQNHADSAALIDFLTGQINYANNPAFTTLSVKDAVKPFYLQDEVYNAFKAMKKAAAADGITLKIVSATRSFEEQKRIWDWKWETLSDRNPNDTIQLLDDILNYSLMPGASRHHWGTDIDINSISNSYYTKTYGIKVYNWLQQHAPEFGFCQVYQQSKACVEPEPWHWSYLPLAEDYLFWYNQLVKVEQLPAFKGKDVVIRKGWYDSCINGIDATCASE